MQIAARAGAPTRDSHARRMLYARAAMLAVAVAFIVTVATASGGQSATGRLGGDYPAFYAAGSIVADGDWDRLYEPARQLEAQQELFGGQSDADYLYFAYPPHLAALYRPFAAVDYRTSYALHSILMVAAVVGALWLLRPVIGVLDRNFELVVIASLLCYPLLRAVSGGQNTGLTVLLVAAAWRALHDDHDVAAGMCIGLLLYKPQFALPLLGLLVIRRAWRAVGAGVGTGLALWLLGVAVMGVGWLGNWWSQVAEFSALDADVNGHNAVSWLGFAEGLLGSGSMAAAAVGGPLMLATVVGLILLWRNEDQELNTLFAAGIVGMVLLSPHAMFYDVGLLVLTALVVVDHMGGRAIVPVCIVWALAWTQVAASMLGFAPLFVVIVGSGIWFLWRGFSGLGGNVDLETRADR